MASLLSVVSLQGNPANVGSIASILSTPTAINATTAPLPNGKMFGMRSLIATAASNGTIRTSTYSRNRIETNSRRLVENNHDRQFPFGGTSVVLSLVAQVSNGGDADGPFGFSAGLRSKNTAQDASKDSNTGSRITISSTSTNRPKSHSLRTTSCHRRA